MPIIDAGLVGELNLDGSPNSLQRVELAIHQRFESHAQLLASPADVDSLLTYLVPIFERFAGCQAVPGQPGAMVGRQGQPMDLNVLLGQVFERGNGQVLFMACYQHLTCVPQN